jgi:phenylalanyl-tRNA synthetase beta chain
VPALTLANPLSEDHSVLRPLLLPGLLDAARRNAAHGAAGVALFESAHVYAPDGDLDAPHGSPEGATPASERHHLAGLLTESAPRTWRNDAGPADFYAAKGYVDALLAAVGLELVVEPSGDLPYLHPGRAARALVAAGDGRDRELVDVGWIGELHPLVAREWDLGEPGGAGGVAGFELDADAIAELTESALATYADVATFPAVLQDIAVVAPADVSAATIEETVADAGGELLASTAVFDVYVGEQVGEGNRSLALRLEFRAPDRTLTEDEVVERRAAIEAALGEIGGRLRG